MNSKEKLNILWRWDLKKKFADLWDDFQEASDFLWDGICVLALFPFVFIILFVRLVKLLTWDLIAGIWATARASDQALGRLRDVLEGMGK